MSDAAKPMYHIGVVAEMLTVHPQTLRLWERKSLIRPSRTRGRTRMYSPEDVDDIRRIIRLTRDLGVNLAGVEIILKMRRQLLVLQAELSSLGVSTQPPPRGAPREATPDGRGLVRVADRRLRKLDVI